MHEAQVADASARLSLVALDAIVGSLLAFSVHLHAFLDLSCDTAACLFHRVESDFRSAALLRQCEGLPTGFDAGAWMTIEPLKQSNQGVIRNRCIAGVGLGDELTKVFDLTESFERKISIKTVGKSDVGSLDEASDEHELQSLVTEQFQVARQNFMLEEERHEVSLIAQYNDSLLLLWLQHLRHEFIGELDKLKRQHVRLLSVVGYLFLFLSLDPEVHPSGVEHLVLLLALLGHQVGIDTLNDLCLS